ncbi:MAG: LPXTG cell wall anchor domain-containing protein [Acidimicrobiales bacterium]|nr:LPXTG cell wall anchor domain-containing protein [Acidimicrobiales bacterium]
MVEIPHNGTQQLNDCKIGKAGGICTASIGGNKIVVTVPPGSFNNLNCDPADVVITNVSPSSVSLPVNNGDTVFVFGLGVLCIGVPVTEPFSPPISSSVTVVVPGKVSPSQIKVFSVGAFGGVSPSAGNETWKPYDLTQAPEASPTESGTTGTETSFAASLPNIVGDPYFAFSITSQQSPTTALKSGHNSSSSLVAIGAALFAALLVLFFILLAKRRKHAN